MAAESVIPSVRILGLIERIVEMRCCSDGLQSRQGGVKGTSDQSVEVLMLLNRRLSRAMWYSPT